MLAINVIKIFTLGTLSFVTAFTLTPLLTHYLYKYELWRKETRDKSIDGKKIPIFKKFHGKEKDKTPRFGGLLIPVVTLVMAFLFSFLAKVDGDALNKLNFLSRGQTWLPLFALVSASLIGVVDDSLQVFSQGKYIGGGLKLRYRLALMALIGSIGGYWFYYELGWQTINIPGMGGFQIGIWYIPLFILVTMATYSGGVIDGLDGLAGGSFATMFGAFAAIALALNQINLAAFCTVLVGVILAFLWFNIPPARFYMGETGIMGLCVTLTVVAFLTNSVLVLPIIGFLLVMEAGSVILQLLSKKFRNKKLFHAAPIHHHFEAKGWPHYKITMRFWVIGVVTAIAGVAIRLLG
ncbi:MAG: hypothetical protein V5A57_03225 [Candidatus Paceibacterota bacterium]